MSEPALHNIIFARVNDKWQATWIVGNEISVRNLRWYEWFYLRFVQFRDFVNVMKKEKML